jgi:DNA polymerase-1
MNTLLALDGTNLLHRSYHALENTQLRTEAGAARWAVHGLVSNIAKYVDVLEPTSLLVAFDVKGGCPSRRELAPMYKEGRASTPPELTEQLLLAAQVLAEMGVASLGIADWEADDILASAAQMATSSGANAIIVSSDKDVHQLVDDRVRVYKPEGYFVGTPELVAKYGITGGRWIEYAAMVGEGADNLAGVVGVGPKRAAALIGVFSDIEDAIGNESEAARVVGAKVAASLVAGADVFRRNRQVGTLRRDLTLDVARVKLAGLDPQCVAEVARRHGIPAAGTKLAGAVGRFQRGS